MDVYLMEGSKVLYRIAIAVLLEFYKYAGKRRFRSVASR